MNKLSNETAQCTFGPVAQLGERTVRIREVRGFDPLRVHHEVRRNFDRITVGFFYTLTAAVLLSILSSSRSLNVCGSCFYFQRLAGIRATVYTDIISNIESSFSIQSLTIMVLYSVAVTRMTTRSIPAFIICRLHMEQLIASFKSSPVRASRPTR